MDERKKRTTSLFLTYLLPTSCCKGWWVAGQQTHGTPRDTAHPHFSSPPPLWLFFLWPLWRFWTLTKNKEKTVTSKIFQENFKWKAKCKKKVPLISSDIFFCLPCVFMDPHPPPRRLTIPQGLAGTRRFLPTFKTISVIIIFFHPCLLKLDLLILCRGSLHSLSVCPAVVVLSVFWIFFFSPRMLCET